MQKYPGLVDVAARLLQVGPAGTFDRTKLPFASAETVAQHTETIPPAPIPRKVRETECVTGLAEQLTEMQPPLPMQDKAQGSVPEDMEAIPEEQRLEEGAEFTVVQFTKPQKPTVTTEVD